MKYAKSQVFKISKGDEEIADFIPRLLAHIDQQRWTFYGHHPKRGKEAKQFMHIRGFISTVRKQELNLLDSFILINRGQFSFS